MSQKIEIEEKQSNEGVCAHAPVCVYVQKSKFFNFQEGLVVGYTLYVILN